MRQPEVAGQWMLSNRLAQARCAEIRWVLQSPDLACTPASEPLISKSNTSVPKETLS